MIEVVQWFGKGIAVANVVWAAWMFYRAWRQHRLDIDYLWLAGIAVSSVVIQWASMPILWLAWCVWLVCAISFAISMVVQEIARRRRQATINAEIRRRIEDNRDGTWELTPSLILTIETRIVEEPQPVEGDTDDQCI